MKELLDITEYLGMPPNAAVHGAALDYWTGIVHLLMLALFLIWAPYFLYVLYRFRATKNPVANYTGAKGRPANYLEGGVVVAEVMLLALFALPTWAIMRDDLPEEPDTVTVNVVAEQFAWNVHYPGADGIFGRRSPDLVDVQLNPLGLDRTDPNAQDDIATVNELHLPVGRKALIYLMSKDVIHSFALPIMRVKQDVVPGLTIPIWFEPAETGESEIACAQLCGLSHYRMRGYLTVHTAEEFDAWLAENAPAMPTSEPAEAAE